MNTAFNRFVCRILVACMIGLPFQVQAGMIGSDAAISAAQAQVARTAVLSFIDRAEVAAQLQAFGLTPQAATDRVAALTDAEVAALAGQIDHLPAGASLGGLLIIMILFIAYLVWWKK